MTTKDLLHIIQQGESPTISEKVDVDRTTLLLPTNGQEPDEEALQEFYDDVEIQDASDKTDDKPTKRQEEKNLFTAEKDLEKDLEKITDNQMKILDIII